MQIDTTASFCCLDDFCKMYEEWERAGRIGVDGSRHRDHMLSLSERLLIMTMFHNSAYKDFKHFYEHGIKHEYAGLFGQTPCYARFVALMKQLLVPFAILLHSLKGEETGIYFTDSSKLAVCHNRRITRNRVFKNLAKHGRTTMGWFFGFKLHIVINHKCEIMAVKITGGNIDDRKPLEKMVSGLRGKLFADKGYIGKELFTKLWRNGLHLITGIRKTMKNYLMPWFNKVVLRKRFIIETLLDKLKSAMSLEHSRHRSPVNAFVHILSCLVAYCFSSNKPKIGTVISMMA